MNNNIRSKYRYNTVTRSANKRNRKNMIKNSSGKTYKTNYKIPKKNNVKNSKTKKGAKNISKQDQNIPKTLIKVILSVAVLILIALISKKVYKIDTKSITKVFSPKENQNPNLVLNYDFKIGLSKVDNFDIQKTANVLTNELIKYSNLPLLRINDDYSIKYVVAENVEKVSNSEYKLTLNKDYTIRSSDVIATINQIKKIGSANIYYSNIQNIKETKAIDDYNLQILLNSEDPYFVYNLNFPIYSTAKFNDLNLYTVNSSTDNLSFNRNDKYSNQILNSINLLDYDLSDKMVESFRDQTIDMFLTSSYDDMQLIGKHDYNLKKYRNGEAIYIFGNKNSNLFKIKEVRQALAYLINREEIVKSNIMVYSEIIDLPYIYSKVQYKYDTTGANNLLLSNGWKKQNDIYTKNIEGNVQSIELKLLVNKDDSLKCNIADQIEQMAQQNGIKLNVQKLSSDQIDQAINNGDYDIVLTTVHMNQNPDINYLSNYLNIDEKIDSAINSVKVSNVSNLPANVQNLQTILSQEVACIGILAKDTNVVYQKNIVGFEDIGYMNIFKNIEKVGKEK